MSKGDFRFIINTGWPSDHDLSVVFSATKGFYGREFTSKCVWALYALFKPLALALLRKSKAEVWAAISEAKDKNQLLYDCAIATATANQQSDFQEWTAPPTTLNIEGPESPNGKAHRPVEPITVDSVTEEDLFGGFEDD